MFLTPVHGFSNHCLSSRGLYHNYYYSVSYFWTWQLFPIQPIVLFFQWSQKEINFNTFKCPTHYETVC